MAKPKTTHAERFALRAISLIGNMNESILPNFFRLVDFIKVIVTN